MFLCMSGVYVGTQSSESSNSSTVLFFFYFKRQQSELYTSKIINVSLCEEIFYFNVFCNPLDKLAKEPVSSFALSS